MGKSNKRDRGNYTGKGVNSAQSASNKRGNNRRGNRGASNHPRDGYDADYARDLKKPGANDPQWYAKTPQLLKDVGTLNFSQVLGIDEKGIYSTSKYDEADVTIRYDDDIPGIMAFHMTPTIGNTEGLNDAVNLATIQIFSQVRKANSGSANYQAPDLMMYLLAVDSIYTQIAQMMRVYAISRTYNAYNRYYPRAVLRALGLSEEGITEVLTNPAKLRSSINTLVLAVNQLAVPDVMPYMARHSQLATNIYLDDENKKAQTYVFNFVDTYRWDPTGETGTALRRRDIGSVMENADYTQAMFDYISDMVKDLVYSTDVAIMCGDIRKAFPTVYHMNELADNATIVPEYNVEILQQIQNMIVVPYDASDITQDPNTSAIIQTVPNNTLLRDIYGFKPILNSYSDNPTPEEVVTSTRLAVLPMGAGSPTNPGRVVCGSEYVYAVSVWFMDTNGVARMADGRATNITSLRFDSDDDAAATFKSMNAEIRWAWMCSNFKHAPFQYFYNQMTDITTGYPMYVFGDLANYTHYDVEVLNRIHSMALLSLFNVTM